MTATYAVPLRGVLFDGEQSLLTIRRRAGVDLYDALLVTLLGTTLDCLDDERQDEGHGEDGDKEVHDQAK